ncbi:MAG: hypothetical protein HC809_12385, partial [Gammaproteobacteria bacterium]|nr:hypothetical protein [Gammaproteobacteria bacterium]
WQGGWANEQLDLTLAANGTVALAGESLHNDKSVRMRWMRGAFSVAAHCWQRDAAAGRLCVDEFEVADTGRLAGSLQELPIEVVSALMPELPAARGSIGGAWKFERARQGQWHGRAELTTANLALVELGSVEDGPVAIPDIAMSIALLPASIVVRAAMGDTKGDVLALDVAIDGYEEDAAVRGELSVNAADVAALSQLSRRVGDVSGRVSGRFDLAGTRKSPRLDGKIEFTDGRFVWLDPHVEVNDLEVALTMPQPNRIELTGNGVTERGRVTLTGVMVDPFERTRQLTVDINASKVDIGIPEGSVRVDAALLLVWQEGLFDLSGKVEVPRARIEVADLPASSVRRSRDVIVVDREVARAEVTRLAVDVNVALGKDVQFAGFGLETRLGGKLRLRQVRDGGVRMHGTLTLNDGEFGAFGQTLTLESGRLVFSGPAEDPLVSARAVRVIDEPARQVKVGVDIRGRAGAIESTLFSNPTMPEADVLSYLVLGRPLSAASAQESGDVTGAAIALGLKGAAPIIDEIRGRFGLEELTATGGSTEELALIAGKRISERIYVRYSYQTFSRMSALLVRLALNDRLSLEATAAEAPRWT